MDPSAPALRFRFIAFLLAYILVIPSRCQPNLEHRSCSISGNYTASGMFAKNLNQVLHSLATTIPTTGFSTSTAGVGPSRVYGLALCRGDAPYEDCRTCVANATGDAINLCPGSISVKMWYTYCLIRYSNLSFFDTFDEHGFITCNTDRPSAYPDIFNRQLDSMISNLSAEAADGTMFAMATRDLSPNNDTSTPKKIYGLVQCTRDLSPVNCSRCLSHLRYRTVSTCAGYEGGRSAAGACVLLYDTDLFFRVPRIPPVAPLHKRLSAKYFYSPPRFCAACWYLSSPPPASPSHYYSPPPPSYYYYSPPPPSYYYYSPPPPSYYYYSPPPPTYYYYSPPPPGYYHSPPPPPPPPSQYYSPPPPSYYHSPPPPPPPSYYHSPPPSYYYSPPPPPPSYYNSPPPPPPPSYYHSPPPSYYYSPPPPSYYHSPPSYYYYHKDEEENRTMVICLSTILPLVALCCCLYCLKRWHEKRKQESQISNLSAAETDPEETAPTPEEREEYKLLAYQPNTETDELEEIKECNILPVAAVHLEERGFRFYDLETIMVATNDFSHANKLGEGGYGPVYKGKLGGVDVAVKRLRTGSGRGKEEFINEVKLVAKLQHWNLVRLLGCCAEKNERILVYEYMSNTSLDKFLFDSTMRVLLDWPKRLKIINGVARGLLYLHEDSRLTIIHRDLKASNVLLDMDMTPKISDFGLARNFEGGQTHASTVRFAGTHGYMAPEYLLHGRFSPKYDVFSFGVLILEIVGGLRNQPGKENLLEHAWRLWGEERTLELMDTSLLKSCQVPEVLRCIQIGLLCVQDEPQNRPPMSSVVLMLGSTSTELPSPSPSMLFVGQGRIESQTTASASLSTYGLVNVADLEAR